MSTSIVSSPSISDPLRPVAARRNPPRQMSPSIDCYRSATSVSTPLSFSPSTSPIAENLIEWPRFPELPLFIPATGSGDVSGDAVDAVWAQLRSEAFSDAAEEPILARYYYDLILRHASLESALSHHLAAKLALPSLLPSADLRRLLADALTADPSIRAAACADLLAARDRDPACAKMAHCFLYYKGFLAIQSHRVAHRLWISRRRAAALMIQSRSAEVFAVDIHPAAKIGVGILLDHATGVVIGETAVVGDDVSILHNVTLGGTGKESGDRHPKICDGVLVGAGTQILGRVRIGKGAKVGAGSVVLKDVPARTTAVGNPARLLGGKENPVRMDRLPGLTMDHTSWSDYVI